MIDRSEHSHRTRNFVVLLLIIIIAGSGLIAVVNSFVIVPAGSRGVLLNWGQVIGILGEGLHFKIPFAQSVEIIDVRVQKAERLKESAGTKDLQEVTVDIALNYQLNPDIVDIIYKNLGRGFQVSVIEPNMDESLKAVTAKFTAEELIIERDVVKAKLKDELQGRLTQFSITVLSVSFTDFKFSEQFTKSIEDKVTAYQKALEAQNNLARVSYEQQQKIILAQAEANATVTKAAADAKAVIINAEAQAEAIKLVQEQLTLHPEYLQYLSIQNWNGELPTYFGSGLIPFLNIGTNSTK